MSYIPAYRLKIFEVHFSMAKLLESVQNYRVLYFFHYVWSSSEIMWVTVIVLLLEIILHKKIDYESLTISTLFGKLSGVIQGFFFFFL